MHLTSHIKPYQHHTPATTQLTTPPCPLLLHCLSIAAALSSPCFLSPFPAAAAPAAPEGAAAAAASPLRRLLSSDTFGLLGGGWGGNSWGRSYGGYGGYGGGYNRE
jgi:hypothetical protein